MNRRIIERTVPVRVAPPTVPLWTHNRPPDPTAADEGTFDAKNPVWTVFIIPDPDDPNVHKLRVHDLGGQLYEAVGDPRSTREMFDLLTGVGPLSRADIEGVLGGGQ